MPKPTKIKKVKRVVKKVVKPKEAPKPKKSAIDSYLELEEQMKIAFKKLCEEKLSVNDLEELANKSRVQKEFACSKLVKSGDVNTLLVVVKRSFDYRQEAAERIINRVDEASNDDIRVLIQKNACADQASYILEERKKARNLKRKK